MHTDVGIQQAGGAVHNAQRGRIGVVLCSGRAPSSIDSGKTNQVHWFQEQFDQAGVVRGYVKWAWELRTNDNIHDVVQRAFQVASSEPCGPVYLCLPQDLLTEKITAYVFPTWPGMRRTASPQADNALLEEAASMLVRGGKSAYYYGPLRTESSIGGIPGQPGRDHRSESDYFSFQDELPDHALSR